MPCESTLVGIGTCPQHCIEPRLSQALLLGAHLSGPTYISFFSIAMLFPLCILFCYIPISWKPLSSSQPTLVSNVFWHLVHSFLIPSSNVQPKELFSYTSVPKPHCHFWISTFHVSFQRSLLPMDRGWRCWNPVWHRSARTATCRESGPSE